jgi:hypothetical protein
MDGLSEGISYHACAGDVSEGDRYSLFAFRFWLSARSEFDGEGGSRGFVPGSQHEEGILPK